MSVNPILQNNNQAQLDALTREDIMGDMVYAASLSYYAQMIAQGKMATRPLGTHYELVGSSGIIGYKPQVEKLFGMPIRLKAGGMSCDIIDAVMTEHSNNDQAKHVQANRQIGMIGSSLEHQVLEQLFAQNGEQGFSAVKAIQLANEQGQKIYTITKDNYQEVIPQLQLASHAIADIRAAAQAGLTVTTHQKRISINGYTGEGYIILNDRGVGAYLINGGLYGGILAVRQFLSLYMIELNLLDAGSLFLFGSIPKRWIGVNPFLLGSVNELTSVLRGIFKNPIALQLFMRMWLIPTITILAVFIGTYNFTILVQAIIHGI